MKKMILLVLLVVPTLAGAETWRWRDANGRLHYSNVADNVPAHATQVAGQIGFLDGNLPAPDPKQVAADLEYYDKLHAERAKARSAQPAVAAQTQIAVPALSYPLPALDRPLVLLPALAMPQTPPVGAWLWAARFELAWRELGVAF